MKVAINSCWGGFAISEAVARKLRDKGVKFTFPGEKYSDGSICERYYGYLDNDNFGIESDNYNAYRADPRLIEAIEEVGIDKASDDLANISIVVIPDDIEWNIHDYDGMEHVEEAHRKWY